MARREDASAITAIYNQGIEDRVETFETEPREVARIEAWFQHAKALVSVEGGDGEVLGYAVDLRTSRSRWAGMSATDPVRTFSAERFISRCAGKGDRPPEPARAG